jgi:hydrogenase maturation protease
VSGLRILGIGSPSGDDQAGWLVIDALRAAGLENCPDWVIDKLDRPGASLIPLLQDADHVILIDAMQSGGTAGTLRHFDRADWPAYLGGLSSHGFGVLAALSLARELGSLPPRLDLYGIEIASALPGEAPCAVVRAATLSLATRLRGEVNDVSPR